MIFGSVDWFLRDDYWIIDGRRKQRGWKLDLLRSRHYVNNIFVL
jgi:hypothetical protein